MRWVVLRCGLLNQPIEPQSLFIGECDGLIAGMTGQNESRSSSGRFTDWLPTEPYESSFCPGVICNKSFLKKTAYPQGGDLSLWRRMIKPLADVESEPSHFKIIEH